MPQSMIIQFSSSQTVPAVSVRGGEDLALALSILRIPIGRPAISLVGGAAGLDRPEFTEVRMRMRPLLLELFRFAVERGAVLIDGGTFSGVMRLAGEARAATTAEVHLVGVAPSGLVTWPGKPRSADAAPLDANHTAFMLVEGDRWGVESDVLAALPFIIANKSVPLEIVVNGGAVTRHDVRSFVAQGGTVLTWGGTGRFADDLAAAVLDGRSEDSELSALLNTGRIYRFDIQQPVEVLNRILNHLLPV